MMNFYQRLNSFLQRIHIQPEPPHDILSADEINAFIRLKKSALLPVRHSQFSDTGHHGQKMATRTGQGMDYAESRKYSAGDDVRSINWIQSARSQDLIVNVYLQENEVRDFILFDCRHTMYFGTLKQPKIAVAIKVLISAVLESLSLDHDIKVIVVNNEQIKEKSITDINSAIACFNQLACFTEEDSRSRENLPALSKTVRLLQEAKPAYSTITVISDLNDIDMAVIKSLNTLSATNKIQLCRILDPLEIDLPDFSPIEYHSMINEKTVNLHSKKEIQNFRQNLLQSQQSITGLIDQLVANSRTYSTTVEDSELTC